MKFVKGKRPGNGGNCYWKSLGLKFKSIGSKSSFSFFFLFFNLKFYFIESQMKLRNVTISCIMLIVNIIKNI